MPARQQTYWGNLFGAIQSSYHGLKLTLRQFLNARKKAKTLSIADSDYFKHQEGIVTIQYPHEMLPVPDNGRYRLHNEIDDCIVCDKCAKICPVNCIEIEPIKAVEEIGKTSDGTPKRIYAAKFDIDMAKCCFCGLCTTVCPTECLTMTKVYDFSVVDIREHNFAFAEMSQEAIMDKKKVYEDFQKAKAASQPPPPAQPEIPSEVKKENVPGSTAPSGAKPVFRPKIKPPPGTPPAAT